MMTGMLRVSFPVLPIFKPSEQGHLLFNYFFVFFFLFLGKSYENEFDKFEVQVPRDAADDSPQARWNMNGTLRIRTRDQ